MGANRRLFDLAVGLARTGCFGDSSPGVSSLVTEPRKDWRINTMRMTIIGNIQFPHAPKGPMSNEEDQSVQEKHAPESICFGCGPANSEGLRIRSFRKENGLEMKFQPSEEHQAFPGMINGGIIGTLLDCHGNWTAAMALMDQSGSLEAPCTVTASYSIKLRRPTPFGPSLTVMGEVVSIEEGRANVRMTLICEGKVCATGKGLFVAVKEGHPAYHRWN